MWYYCMLDTTADPEFYKQLRESAIIAYFPKFKFGYKYCFYFQSINQGRTCNRTAFSMKQNRLRVSRRNKVIEFEVFLNPDDALETLKKIATEISESYPRMEYHFKWIRQDANESGFFHYDSVNREIHSSGYQNYVDRLNTAMLGFNFIVDNEDKLVKEYPNINHAREYIAYADLTGNAQKIAQLSNEDKDLFRMCTNYLL